MSSTLADYKKWCDTGDPGADALLLEFCLGCPSLKALIEAEECGALKDMGDTTTAQTESISAVSPYTAPDPHVQYGKGAAGAVAVGPSLL